MSCRILPLFSCRRFKYFRNCTGVFDVIINAFVQGDKYTFIFLHIDFRFSQDLQLKINSSSAMYFWHICQLSDGCHFVPFICVRNFVVSDCFNCYRSVQYALKSETVSPPIFFFLFRISFTIWALLWFHMNFWIFFIFCEVCHGNCFWEYIDL